MAREKDIRFTRKKVDESWKESVTQDTSRRVGPSGRETPSPKEVRSGPRDQDATQPGGSWKQGDQLDESGRFKPEVEQRHPEELSFKMFVSSLAAQGLVQLGDLENPVTRKKGQNLGAAQETIELLLMLKEKTRGNLTREEDHLLETVIADLQVRYVELAG